MVSCRIINGIGKFWCEEMVYSRNEPVDEGDQKMDAVRGCYLSGMNHRGWKET